MIMVAKDIEMIKNYGFTGETKNFKNKILRQIIPLEDFEVNGYKISKGSVGGWIEDENILKSGSWIGHDSIVISFVNSDSYIGNNCFIDEEVFLNSSVTICNNVIIESYCMIGMSTFIRNNCKLGSSTYIGNYCTIEGNVSIGKSSKIGFDVRIKSNSILARYSNIEHDVRLSENFIGCEFLKVSAYCNMSSFTWMRKKAPSFRWGMNFAYFL